MSEMPETIYAAGCDGMDIAYAVSGEGWTERTTETVYTRADIAEQQEAELVEAMRKLLDAVGKTRSKVKWSLGRPALPAEEQELLAAMLRAESALVNQEAR